MKRIALLTFVFIFNFSFSQKKELRKALKEYDKGNIELASKILSENQSIFESADQKVKLNYYLVRGKIARDNKNFQLAFDLLTPIKDAASIKDQVVTQLNLLSNEIVNSAIDDNEKGDFKSSTEKLYLAYLIDPEFNIDYLYFAASSAVNDDSFDVALGYYNQLKEMGYTGVVTKYYVTEIESKVEEEVTESEFKLYQKSKDYENHRTEDTPSKFPEIVKNIALIHAQMGDNDKAIAAVKEARLSNPTDLNLILTEANIYSQLDEKEKFQSLMNEAINQDPENATLYYNIAVVSSDLGEKESARDYYEKAIEIDPSYQNAYLNLVALILEGEQVIVEQMNSLGTSAADNVKYDALKLDRENLYSECIPILKSLIEIGEDDDDGPNKDAIKTLMNIYGTVGDNEGYKEMKLLLE